VLLTVRAGDGALAEAAPAPPTPATALPSRGAADFSHLTRPSVLPALYVATAVTQAMDAHSTLSALRAGAQEANPLMRGAAARPGAFLALKAGAAAGTILFAEKLWSRNRGGAIAAMVALNVVTSVIAAHNYAVGARLR
jgi:hypothetical protein